MMVMCSSVLSGCGQSTSTDSSPNSTENGNSETSDEPYEVVLEIVTLGAEYKDIPAIESAINEITEPSINCTVSILNMGIADHANKMSLMIAGGEKLDLCMVGLTTSLSSMVSDGMLYEMDDLLKTSGSDLVTLFGENINAGQVAGTTYAVPANNAAGKAGGFLYNKEMADAAGVTIPERCTVDELEEYYSQIREKNPDVYFTSANGGTTGSMNFYNISSFSDSSYYSYGVIVSPQESTTIENWYEADEAKEYYARIRKWYKEGMLPSDSMTSGLTVQDRFSAKQIFCMHTGYAPVELSTQATNYSFETGITQVTDSYIDSSVIQERMWGIPVTSNNPKEAMKFLNFIYSNTEVANLLTHGLEGVNYEKTESEGIVEKLDVDDPGYNRIFSMFGDQTKIYYNTPAKEGIQEDVAKFSANASEALSLGYVFDSEGVAAKAAAVSNVVQRYLPSLECGMMEDVEAALTDLVKAMDDAGIQEVISENQSQLDTWFEEQ